MKKAISIFFLFLFAASYTDLGQLVKVPSLVQHYYVHKEKNSTSFFNYIQEHYSSHRDDGDNKDDMQLPFKMIISTPSLVASLPCAGPALIKSIYINKEIKFPQIKYFIASVQVFSIFHPPRTVI